MQKIKIRRDRKKETEKGRKEMKVIAQDLFNFMKKER